MPLAMVISGAIPLVLAFVPSDAEGRPDTLWSVLAVFAPAAVVAIGMLAKRARFDPQDGA